MEQNICQGCGARLQTSAADEFGFIPKKIYGQGPALCQRCFRINHYGSDEIGPVQAEDSLNSIKNGLQWSTGVVLVVDVLDFEAGFPKELLKLLNRKDLILALNKIDLIPEQTSLGEVKKWAEGRLKKYNFTEPKIVLISARTGYGFPELADQIMYLGKKVLFVGVTNVGKSSVLQKLLQMRIGGGQKQRIKPTISPYPGTTVSMSHWECPQGLVLADSPGYVPKGRISDLVSSEQAVKIIPHKKLTSHLYPISRGELILIPGLCVIECLENKEQGILLGFTGSGVSWQKSTEKHLEKWLKRNSEIINWDQRVIEVHSGEDLVISGLGWVSARKSNFKVKVYFPEGVELIVRPNLVGRKK